MSELRAVYERSIERSYLRLRVLLMLASLGEAFPRQLAKACGIDCYRLDQVLFGDEEDYSTDLALVRLGLVEVVESPHGKLFRITGAGRRKARQLAARAARRERFRAQSREISQTRGEHGTPRVWPRPGSHDSGPVATPAAPGVIRGASFTWSVSPS